MKMNKEILQVALIILMALSFIYSVYRHGKTDAHRECLVEMEKVNKDLFRIQTEYEIWKKYLSK